MQPLTAVERRARLAHLGTDGAREACGIERLRARRRAALASPSFLTGFVTDAWRTGVDRSW